MTERHVHTVKLSDFKAKKEAEGAIDIEGNSGQIYRVPPPEIWPDSISSLLAANDMIGAARALIGDDRYEEFVADGGSSSAVLAIVADVHGISLPESGASSSS